MIKAAIDRILELAAPNTLTVNNSTYVDKKMNRVSKEQRASAITMSTLSSLVRFIKDNPNDFKACDYIVQIMSPTKVRLVSGLDSDREREVLAEVEADIPVFRFGRFIDREEFLIAVQSNFISDPEEEENDKDLILKFAGTVKTGSVTKYGDDGVSQKATIKTGVHSLSEAIIPSPCALKPYRTFVEVDQPISSFIFRMQDAGNEITCALFEADGGAWKIQAQENIRLYLEEQLGEMDSLIIIS